MRLAPAHDGDCNAMTYASGATADGDRDGDGYVDAACSNTDGNGDTLHGPDCADHGQLGDGTTTGSDRPMRVLGL